MLKITRPTLLLDERKCKKNIKRMVEKASAHSLTLAPHFKTHQSPEIGEWLREEGVSAITVSSVKMAAYFAEKGWRDITIAFPVNVLEMEIIHQIIEAGVDLKLLVTSETAVRLLEEGLQEKVRIFIEIDAGSHRSGVATDAIEEVRKLVQAIKASGKMDLYGFYCHAGHTYDVDGLNEIGMIWRESIEKLTALKKQVSDLAPGLRVRMGDTPGCTVVEDFKGVDEICPGNFVFYDLVMNYLDVCSEEEIALAVACPIVAKNGSRNEIVIHGGAVHFSKDHLFDANEEKFYGEVVILEENGWSPIIAGVKLKSISQEHGILSVTEELMETLVVGDVIGVLPVHSCLTAHLMKSYHTLDGRKLTHMEGVHWQKN